MSKRWGYIVVLLLSFASMAQKERTEVWKQERDRLEYRKSEKYQGPTNWYGSYPAPMLQEDIVSTDRGTSGSTNGIPYTPQQIQRDREQRYHRAYGEDGTLPIDPEVERPDPIDLPEVEAPDVDVPDVDVDVPSLSPGFWKTLLFILIFALVFILVYLILKNRKPADKKQITDSVDDWNPQEVSKSKLEQLLDDAIAREDYRSCVRIYFTFILKELIDQQKIHWKKEKTNYHYLLEMQKDAGIRSFSECVRIYDLVWYGSYQIDREMYGLIVPPLENYYQALKMTKE